MQWLFSWSVATCPRNSQLARALAEESLDPTDVQEAGQGRIKGCSRSPSLRIQLHEKRTILLYKRYLK